MKKNNMKRNYVSPKTRSVDVRPTLILTSSFDRGYACSETCAIFHMCLDRRKGKTCFDKQK